jgi:hypothetical protein
MTSNKLIHYVRGNNGDILATLVATQDKKIGLAVRNTKEKCVKAAGVSIAEERAHSGYIPNIPNRYIRRDGEKVSLYQMISDAAHDLRQRADKYFKFDPEAQQKV